MRKGQVLQVKEGNGSLINDHGAPALNCQQAGHVSRANLPPHEENVARLQCTPPVGRVVRENFDRTECSYVHGSNPPKRVSVARFDWPSLLSRV